MLSAFTDTGAFREGERNGMEKTEERESRRRSLLFYGLLVLLLLCSGVGFYIYQQMKTPETAAVIRLGDRELLRAPLSRDARYLLKDGEITEVDMDYTMAANFSAEELSEHAINVLEIRDGRIRCIEANCPDLTCVHIAPMGADTDGIPIACLPHGMIITIE